MLNLSRNGIILYRSSFLVILVRLIVEGNGKESNYSGKFSESLLFIYSMYHLNRHKAIKNFFVSFVPIYVVRRREVFEFVRIHYACHTKLLEISLTLRRDATIAIALEKICN